MSYTSQIAELHAQNMTARDIAAELGCNIRTVIRWRTTQGFSRPMPAFACHPITPERLAAAAAMVADGASFREIERTLHVAQKTLVRHFPGAQWTHQQAAELAAAVRRANRLQRRAAIARPSSATPIERKAA
jgi:transposase-like protein